MTLVDSVGWLEILSSGSLAKSYEKHLEPISEVVVPTIVLYEVYKKLKRDKGEREALAAVAHMQQGRVIPLTEDTGLSAADLSLEHRLSMADAIVYATALQEGAQLVTSDKELKDLSQVVYYPRP